MIRSTLSAAFGVLGLLALAYALYVTQAAQAQPTPPATGKAREVVSPPKATVRFEPLKATGAPFLVIYRSKVPGGWLIGSLGSTRDTALSFYPDPDHKWDGNSIP